MTLFIDGPVGRLEALVHRLPEATAAAVLCHPHPQFGGSMHDAVLTTTERVLVGAGVSCVRFNFRGVGASDGQFDDGPGEADDVCAVMRHTRTELAPERVILLGYSFGAIAAWRAAADLELDRLVLIAPPLAHMDMGRMPSGPEVTLIRGTADQFISPEGLQAFAGDNPDATIRAVEGADHFFTEQDALATALTDIV